eukprot:TRINITY_DN10456_c0_g1_i1.p1 TRINITY_DN10456_c0_g1~~TRINITY_DN10456_c0_g1_i1.p1  ORF type:complete len:320 (+),score=37.84 TRINITY_DN10456_c0_g1_i1:78-962(+)
MALQRPYRHLVVRDLPPGVRDAGLLADSYDLCNNADTFDLGPSQKLLWLMRHGQSTGNVAMQEAEAADQGTGTTTNQEAYRRRTDLIDTQLSEQGQRQALDTAGLVVSWQVKPTLVVCSAMTRAIQTAAIVFAAELERGSARLVVRPEIREFWPDNEENKGRPRSALLQCAELQKLERWQQVREALSDEATADWGHTWDADWASSDGGWQQHCGSPERLHEFSEWLGQQPEQHVAVVSHVGVINNWMNRQPWTEGKQRWPWPKGNYNFGPKGGVARRFATPNAGWLAVVADLEH